MHGATGVATAPDGTRGSPGKPHGQALETCRPVSDRGTGVQPASWRPPAVPGSSTDPPQVASVRVLAIAHPPPQGAGELAKKARRWPGRLTRIAAGAAGNTKGVGGGRPPPGGRVLSWGGYHQ